MSRIVRPHPPLARALQCFRCRIVLRDGLAPPSDSLCPACLDALTVEPRVGVEVAKAVCVVLLLPVLWGVAALFQ